MTLSKALSCFLLLGLPATGKLCPSMRQQVNLGLASDPKQPPPTLPSPYPPTPPPTHTYTHFTRLWQAEEIPGLPPDVAAVGAGHFCSFAATAEGQLWSWGRNAEGQLGRALAEHEFGCSAEPQPVDALARQQVGRHGCWARARWHHGGASWGRGR